MEILNLSEIIKSKRESQGLTLMDVSLDAELSMAYISDIENGNKRPLKRGTLEKLGDALDIPYKNMVEAVIESVREDLGE